MCCLGTKHFEMSKATKPSSIGNCFVFDSGSSSYSRFVSHRYITNDNKNASENVSGNYNKTVTKQYDRSRLC